MPYSVRKVRGKGCYSVKNVETGRVHAKCTTLTKAKRQERLLRAIDHGFVTSSPRRRAASSPKGRKRSPSPKRSRRRVASSPSSSKSKK